MPTEINESFVLKNELIPKIEESLKDKSNIRKMMNAISKYADNHSDILLTSDMSQRLIFADSDKKIMFTCCDVDESDIKKALKASSINSTWKKANNPFYIICMLLMHYFYNVGNKENDEYGNAVALYLGYNLYTTNHKATFTYAPNKQCMDYTIANMNNKFIIIQEKSIHNCIEHIISVAMEGRYKDDIRRGADDDFASIISALDTRISGFINNIGDEFYKNYRAGKYMTVEDEDLQSEDNFHMSDNNSYKLSRVVKHTMSEIITKGFDEVNVIDRSIALSGNNTVSKKKLALMLQTIVEEKPAEVEDAIETIISIYVMKGGRIEDVKTMKFVSGAISVYRSNLQDELTYHLRDLLNIFIETSSVKYGRNYISQSKTSMDNYRRSIHSSLVLAIFESSK